MHWVRHGFILTTVFSVAATVLLSNAYSSSAPPLKPNEQIVKTKDGCGFVVDTSSPGAAYETEARSKLTWGGPCVEGLAMGEGWISEGDYRYVDIPPHRGWAWYGRIFGAVETRVQGGAGSSVFIWDGKHVSYNTLSVTKPVWGKQHHERSRVSDGNTLVMTNTRGCILEAKTIPECKQESKFEIPGVVVFDLQAKKNTQYNCPDLRSTQGCEALWAEHAGPAIERIKAFVAENEPKVVTRKREIAPLIAGWRPAPNAKQEDAARHAALRTAQLAEREQREAKNAAALDKMKRETEKLQRETEALQAENAAAAKKAKEERARDRREAMNMLGNAAVAASGGKTAVERRNLALESLSGAPGSPSSLVAGNNDCHCIEVWADAAGEYLKNICDYPVRTPNCVVGYSCDSEHHGFNGDLDARGMPNHKWDTVRIQNGSKSGARSPWSYGAIAAEKYKGVFSPDNMYSWTKAKARGWVCSENRQPATLPPPSPQKNDIRVR